MSRSVDHVLILAMMCFSLACATPGPHVTAPADARAERILYVDGRAGRLRVSDGSGGGIPVVFLHGLGSDLEAWRAQLDHLRPTRRAIAYGQRGHGQSDRPRDGTYTIAALTEDLESVVNALGLDRFFLVGHSVSGQVLTAYAAVDCHTPFSAIRPATRLGQHSARPDMRCGSVRTCEVGAYVERARTVHTEGRRSPRSSTTCSIT